MKPKLQLPLRDIYVTQQFGENAVPFYKNLGMIAHNGTDFRARTGMPVKACHNGEVTWSGKDSGGGISVTLCSNLKQLGYKTIYYHLSKVTVGKGKKVKAGDIIGHAGNTGKYTTGAHLHLGLKWIRDGKTLNHSNGYMGAIDPAMYMPENWDKPNAYHRYYRKGSLAAEVLVRFKNPWLHRRLKKLNKLNLIYDNVFINKLTYGGWSFEEAINDAFHETTAYLKKSEYLKGEKPFSRTRI